MNAVEKQLKELLCRHCDGISHAESCDIKQTCPVLRGAPKQITKIFTDAGYLPVQEYKLEGLTDEEIEFVNPLKYLKGTIFEFGKFAQAVSQAVLSKNSKVKLYRVKE